MADAGFTIEQQQALALARARMRMKQAQGDNGINAQQPASDPSTLRDSGFTGAVGEGLRDMAHEWKQSAQSVVGQPDETPEPKTVASSPFELSDLVHPIRAAEKATYNVVKNAPSIGGAAIGGAMGTSVGGPIAGAVGAGAGAAVMTAVQSLGPNFAKELQQTPGDPDGAFQRATRGSAIEGMVAGVSMGAFKATPFGHAVKDMLFQAFGVQPAISVAGAMAEEGNTNKPSSLKEYAAHVGGAYVAGVLGTAVPFAAEKAGVAGLRAAGATGIGEKTKAIFQPAADMLEKVFSPTTVDPAAERAEAIKRELLGQSERSSAQAAHTLEQVGSKNKPISVPANRFSAGGPIIDRFQSIIEPLIPEFQKDIADIQHGISSSFSSRLGKLIEHIESNTQGPFADQELAPVAEAMQRIYQERRTRAEATNKLALANFIDGYYQHLWQDYAPQQKGALANVKEGSSRSTKKRSIPTVLEGLKQGFTPITANPLEQTMLYVTNMDRYLHTIEMFERGENEGLIKRFMPGAQHQGWAPLDGVMAQSGGLHNLQAYAPEGFARVYNNFISSGWHKWEVGGKLYDNLLKASNFMTMSELGFSAFHVATMVNEALVSKMSQALGLALKGDTRAAVTTAVKAPLQVAGNTVRGLAGKNTSLGGQVIEAYKKTGPSGRGAQFDQIIDLLTGANMRLAGGRQAYMRTFATENTAAGSFWQSWKRGSLGRELKEMWNDAKPGQGSQLTGMKPFSGWSPTGVVRQFANVWGRTMETVAHPIFDSLVPQLKAGAAFEHMQQWLENNPAAPHEEQLAAARQIVDSIDNRFGELNMDNVFWHKMLKQTLQVMVRAVGWDLGTLREIGGGAKDIGEAAGRVVQGGPTIGKVKQEAANLSPRALYTLALPATTLMLTSVAAALKTGQLPTGVATYRTGGVKPNGDEEEAVLPGYMKDVYAYLSNPIETVEGKFSTFPRVVFETITNRDWKGDSIHETSNWASERGAPSWFEAYAEHILGAFEPMTIKSISQRDPESKLTAAERLLGIRPKPRSMSMSERDMQSEERAAARRDMLKEKHDARERAREGN